MFGFIRRVARPFGMLGEKIAEVFNIGRKANAVRDIRNTEEFMDLAPTGLRVRQGGFRARPEEVYLGQGYYADMNKAIKNYKYPVG